MMVRDGVTSAFELEVGTGDVAAWYAAREAGQIVNYGVVGRPHPGADEGAGRSRHGAAAGRHRRQRHGDRRADGGDGGDPARRARAGRGRDGLRQRLHARRADVRDRAHVPRRRRGRRLGAHPHARRARRACTRRSPRPTAAHAPLHIVHVNSSAGDEIDAFLAAIKAARDAGQDVTTEAYPYGAGMTEIQSALFDDWQTLARRAIRAAPTRLDRRAPDARDVRQGAQGRRHGDHPRPIRGADARRHRQPAGDDRQRRLHRERPRPPAHVGHVTPRCWASTCARRRRCR